MTAPTPPAPAAATALPVKKNKMPKVAFASFMGTVIEFYDFNIFATASALVFRTPSSPLWAPHREPSCRTRPSVSRSWPARSARSSSGTSGTSSAARKP